MRVLLDTNILVYREASRVTNHDIGILFGWLDRLKVDKCVHPFSLEELNKHMDPVVRQTMTTKAQSYFLLKTVAPDTSELQAIRAMDKDPNDTIDTTLLNEAFSRRVDLLLTEDRKIHRKAAILGISERVLTIDEFIAKATSEHPDLADYKVLSVRRTYFGEINLDAPFFDSFREDYAGFDIWFKKKSDEEAYVCKDDQDQVVAFLYVKTEGPDENYSCHTPILPPAKRLKIGTFKVISTGHRLGERFIKIIFDNALRQKVDEIYVTIFDKREEQRRLISLLEDWGFAHVGTKSTPTGTEQVYARDLRPQADPERPSLTFPYVSASARKFIVPIHPAYHTELFPDSLLTREKPGEYTESHPHRNALRKVYVSRSIYRDLRCGDIIVFYRTSNPDSPTPARYTSVITTLGVVESVVDNIPDLATLIALCKKRSVFSDQELEDIWNKNTKFRPFIVNFIYFYTFGREPRRPFPNLATLRKHDILHDAPRGFEPLENSAFAKLLEVANVPERFIVH